MLIDRLGTGTLSNRMVRILYEVASFAYETKSHSRSTDLARDSRQAAVMNQRAVALDQQILRWYEDATTHVRHNSNSPSHDKWAQGSAIASMYRDMRTACIWNQCRSARILLHQALLQSAHHPSVLFSGELSHSQSQSVIYRTTDDILESAPFCLGDSPDAGPGGQRLPRQSLRGYFLIWSLQTVIRCPFISEDQFKATQAILRRIGQEFGITYAFSLARGEPCGMNASLSTWR